jgi:NitT/TauT family transport system ATP-binding protein
MKPIKDLNSFEFVLQLNNISKSYDGGKTFVIKDLSMSVKNSKDNGEIAVILGPSGCGKSTILRFISRLDKPTSGEISIFDEDLRTSKQNVGQVFQQYSSFPWRTVIDNVALGLEYMGIPKSERLDRAAQMIEKVGLKGQEHKYAKYPSLSGGQLQRVAIARSLLANPKFLLMDEPFGALDVKTRAQMQEMLIQIKEDLHPTIVLVTHDIREAVFLADEIFIMEKPPSKILKNIKIDLGMSRSRFIEKTSLFTDYVNSVNEIMNDTEKM